MASRILPHRPERYGKFVAWEGKEDMLAKMGFTTDQMVKIGILEVMIALLFLFQGPLYRRNSAYWLLGGATVRTFAWGIQRHFRLLWGW